MKALLIDVTRCTGCERCVKACTASHALGPRLAVRKQSEDGLSSRRFAALQKTSEGRHVKKQCLHCLTPACVDACPVGAIKKTPEGPVTYEPDKCMGCRYCMLACPIQIPRYEWDAKLPYMKKCDMCFDRIRDGGVPACVEACPHEACIFGERDEMLRVAKKRLADCKAPYLHHIYGERELGGTSVLYLSDVPLATLGLPGTVGDRTLSSFTWPLISKTPWMALGVGALLTGTYFIIRRRMEHDVARPITPGAGVDESERKEGQS